MFQCDVPNGYYQVTLWVAKGGLGDMDIILEGRLRERDPELMRDVSCKKPPQKPMHQKICQVEVTDGRLDIGFTSTSQYPQLWRINAIEVEPVREDTGMAPNHTPNIF